jgi:2-dehydropantoate 2-reductase
MRILIFGAGNIGSTLGLFLVKGGIDVTIFARGKRYEEIKQNGLVLVDGQNSKQFQVSMPVISEEDYSLHPIPFDFILVTLRHQQVANALPILAKISPLAPIIFLGNTCFGPDDYIRGVGQERVILGFPNSGGIQENGNITFWSPNLGKRFPITVGELNGQVTTRLRDFQALLKSAGMRVKFEPNIDGFLKAHVAGVLSAAYALYQANDDLLQLAKNKSLLKLLVRAMKENKKVVQALGMPRSAIQWIPESFLVFVFGKFFKTRMAEIGFKDAIFGRAEIDDLEHEFRKLIVQSNVPTPAFDALIKGSVN